MKKFTALLLAALLLFAAGCASAPSPSPSAAPETSAPAAQPTPEATPEATPEPTAEPVVITVGASPVPHSEILKNIVDDLAAQGITLKIVEYTDYVQPNEALQAGDLDANYFQHVPYMTKFNDNGGTLAAAVAVHFEPLGLYKSKTQSLEELKDGAEIAVPNDTTNEARALLLLEAQGLIKLPENADLTITPKDIVENPKNLKFIEVAAEQLTHSLQDVDLAVINGNYALGAGLTIDDTLAAEAADSLASQIYANVLAVREGDQERPEIKALVEALTSENTRTFISETYRGSSIPAF